MKRKCTQNNIFGDYINQVWTCVCFKSLINPRRGRTAAINLFNSYWWSRLCHVSGTYKMQRNNCAVVSLVGERNLLKLIKSKLEKSVSASVRSLVGADRVEKRAQSGWGGEVCWWQDRELRHNFIVRFHVGRTINRAREDAGWADARTIWIEEEILCLFLRMPKTASLRDGRQQGLARETQSREEMQG